VADTEKIAPGARQLGLAALVRSWWARFVTAEVDHQRVLGQIMDESSWDGRFAFMVTMSAGIAVLGLLLSSPAVVIGAMLISPLMGPILGLGFSLALVDFAELRRAGKALALGSVLAIAFTAAIVLLSPLKVATPEILGRTKPNLFDLLVALFAALAGTFAIIRGRGETIVGVAIATALMPPLAVVGYGLATWNLAVLGGASALFATNFITMAIAAMVMARLYGFGRALAPHQSVAQTLVLAAVFVGMAVPLAFSLTRIARQAITVSDVRSFLSQQFGGRARVTQLDLDFDVDPIAVRGVVIAPRANAIPPAELTTRLEHRLGRPVRVQVDQVLLSGAASALDAQREELKRARESEEKDPARMLETAVQAVTGAEGDALLVDRDHQRIEAHAVAIPGATLVTFQSLEQRLSAAGQGWQVIIIPPLSDLPTVNFASGDDKLDADARQTVLVCAWAARRWNVPALLVPGMSDTPASRKPTLSRRRAEAVAALLKARGIEALPAAAAPLPMRLAIGSSLR